jgi:hypothetical protein
MPPLRNYLPPLAAGLAFALAAAPEPSAPAAEEAAAFPAFDVREIDTDLKVGYAVLLVDVDGDGKKDIVVADTTRVVWYQNPTWKRRIILDGHTKPDNVCLAAYDIDGDGRLDLALGADWKPFNTKSGGTLQWLKQGKDLDAPWTLYPIAEEPTVHRIRFADLDASGKPALVLAPLMGRNSTAAKNWADGVPVRLLAFRIPKDPTRDRWTPEVIDESLHVVHNLFPVPSESGKGSDLLTASYEGVTRFSHDGGKWVARRIGAGNQDNPAGSRGASEVKRGRLKGGKYFIATIEPWHGNQVVVYTPPAGESMPRPWDRHVIDDKLKWGHAVWCADLDGDGGDELIIGVRDDLSARPGERRGVRIYKATDDSGTKWERHLVDEGGVAVEDLAAADLDGDGRTDIVAVGRQTHNVRVYRNRGGR